MTESPFELTDKRRIDPETGEPREANAETPADAVADVDIQVPDDASSLEDDAVAAAQKVADERLEDLLRERASFTNYRNRALRDQEAARIKGIEDVLASLLPVLDDIDRARQAGELEGPFAAIADKLDGTLAKFEIARFGEVGDEFDPNFHDALMHEESAEAQMTTVKFVVEPGYKIGERVVRAARVAVVGPQH